MVTTENRARIAVLGRIPDVGLSRHLIDAAALGRMRATAHLVNTARNVAAVLAGDPPLTPVG